ncbi:transposase [Massilia sp. 9096]|uniref:transposase n=1 Tax=Massilia sp. 9096 TaxID=1500894 RepID=UPI0035A57E18
MAESYSHTGRPSVDPELMARMLIIGYCYGILKRQLRLRGPSGAHDEFLLAATVENLRRMAKTCCRHGKTRV